MHSLFAGFNGGSRALSAVSESGLFLTGDGEKIFLPERDEEEFTR